MKHSIHSAPRENKVDKYKVEFSYAASCKHLYITIKPYKSLFENSNGKGNIYVFFERYVRS